MTQSTVHTYVCDGIALPSLLLLSLSLPACSVLPGPPVSIALDISTALTVTWTPPAPQSSPILRYNVSCNPTTSVGPTLMFLSGDNSTLSTSFDGVVPDTLYSCCVAAINSAGNGAARCSTVRTSEARELTPTAHIYHSFSFPTVSVISSSLSLL